MATNHEMGVRFPLVLPIVNNNIMMTFLEYLKESSTIEWPRDVLLNVDSKTITFGKSDEEAPVIDKSQADQSQLIPLGKKALNAKAVEKQFSADKDQIPGFDDVIEYLQKEKTNRLQLLDKFLGQVYKDGKGITFKELYEIVSNEDRKAALKEILDQLEGKAKDGEQQWVIKSKKAKKNDGSLPEIG